MALTTFTSPACCTPCSGIQTVQVPGAAGTTGAAGADGEDGVNAYTYTDAQFLMPSTEDDPPFDEVTISVLNATWMVVGQMLYVQGAGYMLVEAILSSTSVTLSNPANGSSGTYGTNSALGVIIPAGSKISPAGIQGIAGLPTTPVYHCDDNGKDYTFKIVLQDGIPTIELEEV